MDSNSQNTTTNGNYLDWLKQDFAGLIDELELSDFRKRLLKSRWLDQVVWMEGRAGHAQRRYYALRLTAIVGGILIPVTVTLSRPDGWGWMVWVATVLGAVVAIVSAVEEFFNYGERWRHYRNTVELLKIEAWQFFQLSGTYKRASTHADAYTRFATRVEAILQEDVQRYITEIVAEQDQKSDESVESTIPAPDA